MHGRATGEVADAAPDKGQDGEYKDRPPNPVVQRQPVCESLEREQQAPLDGPERQPEEELDCEEFVEHDAHVVLQTGIWLHLPGGDGHDVEEGVNRGVVERASNGKRHEGEVHEQVFHLSWCSTILEPSCAGAHYDEDGTDA